MNFFFREAEQYKSEGSDLIIIAPLLKNAYTRLANPVTFLVTPITIEEANRTGWPIPSGAQLENDPSSPYKASKYSFLKIFIGN